MSTRRAKRDRWIWGAYGGIAHHYGRSTTTIRTVVVLLAICITGISGIPVPTYILLGFLLSESVEF